MKWLGLALAVLVACSPAALPRAPCYREVHVTFHAESTFTVDESMAINMAMTDWSKFSGGRIDFSVAYDLDRNVLTTAIYKVHGSDPRVLARDIEVSQYVGHATQVAGWEADDPLRIFLVTDRVPAGDWKYLVAHELGHAAGLRKSKCSFADDDCVHATDPTALMAAVGQHPFNETDRTFCRESCLCP